MYVSLHSPCPSVAHSRFTTDIPPFGKICATLDGVRRLQRRGYREGLYLCRAIRRDHLIVYERKRVRSCPPFGKKGGQDRRLMLRVYRLPQPGRRHAQSKANDRLRGAACSYKNAKKQRGCPPPCHLALAIMSLYSSIYFFALADHDQSSVIARRIIACQRGLSRYAARARSVVSASASPV